METNIEGLKIPYEVRNSSEASKPRIDHKLGSFTVVVPDGEDFEPEELIRRKKDWVRRKRKDFLQFKRKIPEREISDGGKISLLGEEKKIQVEKRRSNEVSDKIYIAEHLAERTSLKDQLEKTLKSEARDLIERKVENYSDHVDEEFNKMFIRDQKTRWGSCSNKQNLNFNWRLILGPEHVLDYVIVHELVHLEEKNHNEDFWSRVRDIYPDYKKSNKWLAENSSKLVFDLENLKAS